ncbi:hypothetical protein FB451DRAFT_1408857 [Mycena latifolia]|nr:hypothetical protein FB451DRAFT_1408857 [Mycena latifolia]
MPQQCRLSAAAVRGTRGIFSRPVTADNAHLVPPLITPVRAEGGIGEEKVQTEKGLRRGYAPTLTRVRRVRSLRAVSASTRASGLRALPRRRDEWKNGKSRVRREEKSRDDWGWEVSLQHPAIHPPIHRSFLPAPRLAASLTLLGKTPSGDTAEGRRTRNTRGVDGHNTVDPAACGGGSAVYPPRPGLGGARTRVLGSRRAGAEAGEEDDVRTMAMTMTTACGRLDMRDCRRAVEVVQCPQYPLTKPITPILQHRYPLLTRP